MKTPQLILCALLISGLITTVCDLTLTRSRDSVNSIQMQSVHALPDELNYGNIEIEVASPEFNTVLPAEDLFAAVNTLNESVNETKMDAVEETQVEGCADGIAGLDREGLMAEANRIMLELYWDRVLVEPVSYACALAETSPDTNTKSIILEQLRSMHQKHLALAKFALASGDQDSLITRGWSELRMDLAKLRKMAADMRNEAALAAR